MSKKLYPNIATKRFQKLVETLEALEATEYSRMSDKGKRYLDKIWKLLELPTNVELEKKYNLKIKG
tara:strand:+ start:8020 stop:8217 length:198 start_codon:yes stop_codon:yes gene_type:complete